VTGGQTCALPISLSRAIWLSGHISLASEQSCDRDILVNIFPMQTQAAQFNAVALRRRRMEKARKPCQRHPECAPIGQFDPHSVLVKADRRCRNAHAMLSR